jgi:CPA2 family monovalent cation:H+ antiporter-2
VGTDEQLRHVQQQIEPLHSENTRQDSNPVDLRSVTIDEDSFLAGKSILESEAGQKYNCIIVGIERGTDSLISPDNSIILEAGDVIWVVGEIRNIQRLAERRNENE